jgi:hypothetical protein
VRPTILLLAATAFASATIADLCTLATNGLDSLPHFWFALTQLIGNIGGVVGIFLVFWRVLGKVFLHTTMLCSVPCCRCAVLFARIDSFVVLRRLSGNSSARSRHLQRLRLPRTSTRNRRCSGGDVTTLLCAGELSNATPLCLCRAPRCKSRQRLPRPRPPRLLLPRLHLPPLPPADRKPHWCRCKPPTKICHY